MKLANLTWPEVDALERSIVVLVPTGSLEQHGQHLPLFTDSLIVTAVAEAIEARIPQSVLLTPTLWLGASQHHLSFAGSLSATFPGYHEALTAIVESLIPHRFRTFFTINGHGGNTESNGIAMRALKQKHPNLLIGHSGYFAPIAEAIAGVMEGEAKDMRHACEAETSLMMHLHPDLVRTDRLRDDGLVSDPKVAGMIWTFDEMTEMGSYGEATRGTAAKGKIIFEAAVDAMAEQLESLKNGVKLVGK